jgi:hypothetical protein
MSSEIVGILSMDKTMSDNDLKSPTISVSTNSSASHQNTPQNLIIDSSVDLDQKIVIGPNGQRCESRTVLEQVLKRYSHITQNCYRGGATGKIPSQFMECECRLDDETLAEDEMLCGLGSGCINREMAMECPPTCPAGDRCSNQKYSVLIRRFQKQQYPPIEIFQTERKGCGLRCNIDLAPYCCIDWIVGSLLLNIVGRFCQKVCLRREG